MSDRASQIVAEWTRNHAPAGISPAIALPLIEAIRQAITDERQRCASILEFKGRYTQGAYQTGFDDAIDVAVEFILGTES